MRVRERETDRERQRKKTEKESVWENFEQYVLYLIFFGLIAIYGSFTIRDKK